MKVLIQHKWTEGKKMEDVLCEREELIVLIVR